VVEGYDSGGRRSASWSGGRWWGWSGRGGTPWRREAQGVIEGVQEWLEESSAGEVLVATGDSASASALGAFSWRKLLEMWPTQCCEVVHLGGGLQRLIGAAAAWGRARVTTWCGAGEEKRDRSTRWCAPFIAARGCGMLAVRRQRCRLHEGRRAKLWVLQHGGGRCSKASAWLGAAVRVVRLTSGPHAV
jgi:hypothetical protein